MKTKKVKTETIERAEARCVEHAKDIVRRIAAGEVPIPKLSRRRRRATPKENLREEAYVLEALQFLNTPGVS